MTAVRRIAWVSARCAFVAAAGAALACTLWLAGCGSGSADRSASPAVVSPSPITTPETAVETPVVEESWTFEESTGRLLRTPNYRVFTTVQRDFLLSRVPKFMEHALTHYTSALGQLPSPRQPMDTYLMANRPQWTRITQRVMGDQAEVYLRIQRGGFSAEGKALLYDIGQRDTFAIAAHEGWHQYTQVTFRNPLPVWLEEGLATYMEGFRWDRGAEKPRFLPWANFERYGALRSAIAADRLIPLDRLVMSTPQELMRDNPEGALQYYAQVWALVHFLNEGEGGKYAEGLRRMLRDAASGELAPTIARKLGHRAATASINRRTGPAVLQTYMDVQPADIEAAYQEFMRAIVRSGGRDRIVNGLSPVP